MDVLLLTDTRKAVANSTAIKLHVTVASMVSLLSAKLGDVFSTSTNTLRHPIRCIIHYQRLFVGCNVEALSQLTVLSSAQCSYAYFF